MRGFTRIYFTGRFRAVLAPIMAILGIILLAAGPAAAQYRSEFYSKPWTALTAQEAANFFNEVDLDERIGVPGDWLSADRQALDWSPGSYLIRVRGAWQPRNLIFYFIEDRQGNFTQLTGAAPEIYAHNAANPIRLTAQTVSEYLWFFGFFVHGEAGPFLIVETPNDTFMPKGISEGQFAAGYENAYDVPSLIECNPETGTYVFSCDVVIMYSNAMFKATMRLKSDGMVIMEDDTPVASQLNIRVSAPITLAAVGDEFVKPAGAAGGTAIISASPYTGIWEFNNEVDLITDRRSPVIRGLASEYSGMPRPPLLTISCSSEGPTMKIDWGTPLSPMIKDQGAAHMGVTVRFGQNRAFTSIWTPSDSWSVTYEMNDAYKAVTATAFSLVGLFRSDIRNAEIFWTTPSFARQMSANDRMVVRSPTAAGSTATAVFDTRGFDTAWAQFSQVCPS